MAEQLRMEAEVVDKFSEPLKRLQDRLKGIRTPDNVKELGSHFEAVHKRVEALSAVMSESLGPAMTGLGVAGVGLGATFVGLLRATRAFAESTADLNHLSVETGLTVNRLRELDSAFDRVGVKAPTVNGAMKTFAANLRDIQRNRGEVFGWLTAQEPQLARQLHNAKPDEAAGRALGFLTRIPNPQERAEAAQRLFGTSDIARIGELGLDGFRAAIRDADKANPPLNKAAIDAAKANEEANARFAAAQRGLRDRTGAAIVPWLTALTNRSADFITDHPDATLGGAIAGSSGAGVIGTRLTRAMFRRFLARGAATTATEAAAGSAGAASVARAPWFTRMAGGLFSGEMAASGGLAGVVGGGAALVEASHGAQRPGMGGQWSPATAATLSADQERLADMRQRLSELSRAIGQADTKTANGQTGGWVSQSVRDEKRELENQIRQLETSIKDVQTRSIKEGTEEGLKQATPEAQKTVKGWFDWIWKSSFDGAMPGGFGGGAKLWNASYEVGGGGMGRVLGGGRFNGLGGGGGGGSRGGLSRGSASETAGTFDTSLPKEARAFLDDIASGESPSYNVMNGGGRFSDMSRHPGGRAAGRYQDLPSTWARISRALGLRDFSPASQDKGNWWLAQSDYARSTGRNLLADLRSGDPNRISGIGRALHGTWISTNSSFASKYQRFLGRQHDDAAVAAHNGTGYGYPDNWLPVLNRNRALTNGTSLGFLGGAQVNPEGNVTVNLNGFPAGTRASTSTDGFFKGVKVNRGRSMSVASEET